MATGNVHKTFGEVQMRSFLCERTVGHTSHIQTYFTTLPG